MTSVGVETTDPATPHIVIRADDLETAERAVICRQWTSMPLLAQNARWFDREDFLVAIERARIIHRRGGGRDAAAAIQPGSSHGTG